MEPLVPGVLTPEQHSELQKSRRPLVSKSDVPPNWERSRWRDLPLVGPMFETLGNAGRYSVKLEDVAEFLAKDLAEEGGDGYVGKKVGVIGMSRRSQSV